MGNNPSRGANGHGSESPRVAASSSTGAPTLTSTLACDGGHLIPMSGTYPAVPQEWDKIAVARMILNRQLAPFYRGLQDEYEGVEESEDVAVEDSEDTVAAQQREAQRKARAKEIAALLEDVGIKEGQDSIGDQAFAGQRHKEPSSHRKAEIEFYDRGTAECPICMLNFPSNINTSRCCDQPICTECLVQIHRLEPDVHHLDPEPVACPFCVEPDFGVFYKPPAPMNRRDVKGHAIKIDDGATGSAFSLRHGNTMSISPGPGMAASPRSMPEPRRKSMSATGVHPSSAGFLTPAEMQVQAPEVVTIDQIYPNWQEKVEAVKAAIARRANRRLIFQQVNGRMIPIGVSGSGNRDLAAMIEAARNSGASDSGSRSSRRSRRSRSDAARRPDYGQDLEDLMMNEAIRLSLLEAEEDERKRKEAEEAEKKKAAAPSGPIASTSTTVTASSSSSSGLAQTSGTSPARSQNSSDREAALSSAVGTSILPAVQDMRINDTASSSRGSSQQFPSSSQPLPISTSSAQVATAIPSYLQTGVGTPPSVNSTTLSTSPSSPDSRGRARYTSDAQSYEDNSEPPMGTSPSASVAPSTRPFLKHSESVQSEPWTPASEASEDDYGYGAYAQLEDDEESGEALDRRGTSGSQQVTT